MCAETAPGYRFIAAECTILVSFQASLLDVSFALTSRNFLDQRRNSWIPFNLYRLAAGWKSIEISILCQANKSSKRRDQKFERASGELNITDCVDQIKFSLRLSVQKRRTGSILTTPPTARAATTSSWHISRPLATWCTCELVGSCPASADTSAARGEW